MREHDAMKLQMVGALLSTLVNPEAIVQAANEMLASKKIHMLNGRLHMGQPGPFKEGTVTPPKSDVYVLVGAQPTAFERARPPRPVFAYYDADKRVWGKAQSSIDEAMKNEQFDENDTRRLVEYRTDPYYNWRPMTKADRPLPVTPVAEVQPLDLTDWNEGTVPPQMSGVYNIEGIEKTSLMSRFQHGEYAYYNCIEEKWYKPADTPERAEHNHKYGYLSDDPTPQQRAYVCYRWRGLRKKAE